MTFEIIQVFWIEFLLRCVEIFRRFEAFPVCTETSEDTSRSQRYAVLICNDTFHCFAEEFRHLQL